MLLRDVHDVDVLREEDDLADRALQLHGVVRREQGLRLADLADHREDVVGTRALRTGALGLRLLELAVRDVVHGRNVKNVDALANPEALEYFRNRRELAD